MGGAYGADLYGGTSFVGVHFVRTYSAFGSTSCCTTIVFAFELCMCLKTSPEFGTLCSS